jgi:hypothetical protein
VDQDGNLINSDGDADMLDDDVDAMNNEGKDIININEFTEIDGEVATVYGT